MFRPQNTLIITGYLQQITANGGTDKINAQGSLQLTQATAAGAKITAMFTGYPLTGMTILQLINRIKIIQVFHFIISLSPEQRNNTGRQPGLTINPLQPENISSPPVAAAGENPGNQFMLLRAIG